MAAGHISIRPKNHKPDITDLPKKLVHGVVWPPIRDGAMPEKVLSRGVQGQRVHQTEAIRNLIFQGIPSGYFITGPGGFPITIVWVFSSPVKSRGA